MPDFWLDLALFLRLAFLQGAHPAQVQRQAHELELCLQAV